MLFVSRTRYSKGPSSPNTCSITKPQSGLYCPTGVPTLNQLGSFMNSRTFFIFFNFQRTKRRPPLSKAGAVLRLLNASSRHTRSHRDHTAGPARRSRRLRAAGRQAACPTSDHPVPRYHALRRHHVSSLRCDTGGTQTAIFRYLTRIPFQLRADRCREAIWRLVSTLMPIAPAL